MSHSPSPLPTGRFVRSRETARRGQVRALGEGGIRVFCFFAALVSVATTFGIVAVLLGHAWPFFRHVSPLDFFGGTVWKPTASPPQFGVLPLIAGTLMIAIGSGLIALPLEL